MSKVAITNSNIYQKSQIVGEHFELRKVKWLLRFVIELNRSHSTPFLPFCQH